MTVYHEFEPQARVPAEPTLVPSRLSRSRVLLVADIAHGELTGALAPAVDATERTGDPFAAMLQLFDDPRDWCLCIVDTDLFAAPPQAADFMRILCFEHPGVPVVQINAEDETGPADLTLTPRPPAEVARTALDFAAAWFSPGPARAAG